MSDPDVIATALHGLAAQADTAPPAADALWRAGQRRRRRNVMAISATAAGAAAVAAVLAFTLGGGREAPAGPGGGLGGPTSSTGPVVLHTPMRFEQVAGFSAPPCKTGIHPTWASGARWVCIRFTGTGMTITRLESARVQRGPVGHRYEIDMRLTPADARRFATLTRELAGQHSPRNRLATVSNGWVLADPVVMTANTAGQAAIPGFSSRPQAEFFLATMFGN